MGVRGNVTFFSEESNKEPVCDVKAACVKLGVALAICGAGESLNRPDESKLSSVRFLLSPLVWLRQPAPIASACHGGMLGCIGCSYLFAIVE